MSGTVPRTFDGPYPPEVTGIDPIVLANKFRLVKQLGVFDDDVVFEALHTGTERRVRVHMLRPHEQAKSPSAERMRRAARAVGRVPHPHVLGVVDSGLDHTGRPFLVYEYFGSATLAELIQREGPLPVETAARIVCQLLDALAALHQHGVVHRCVRPENVLIDTSSGEARSKLTGFSFATVQGKFEDAPPLPRGFSRYAAPEARRNAEATGAGLDVYAVGVLLRHLLSGDAGKDSGLEPRAERAIARACAEDPEERFTGADRFLAAVSMLLPDAGDVEVTLLEDRLVADFRYMQQRRERESGIELTSTGASRMELYPVLMMVEAIYARLRGDGWKQLCQQLPQLERLLPGAGNGPRLRQEGVPAELVIDMLRAADALAGHGDLGWLTEIGEAMVKRGLQRFCPQLPAQLSPPGMVDCVGQLWSSIARHGEVVVIERTLTSARVAIRAQTAPSLEVCAVMAGLMRAQLRTMAEDGEVSTIASQALGDAADIFVLSWTQQANRAGEAPAGS